VSEYDHEPVRGLPGALPQDERILWQGSPDWRPLVTHAFHIRLAAVYFAAIVIWAVMRGDMNTALGVGSLAVVVLAIQLLFAWGVARTTVYTLTTKRVVLRIGVALNKCINLPLAEIETADMKPLGGGHGNIVLHLKGLPRIGYVMLWPHARSLRIVRPQPMLRAIPEAAQVGQLLFQAAQQVQPVAVRAAEPGRSSDRPLQGATA
jgi:Bacterial PH domain